MGQAEMSTQEVNERIERMKELGIQESTLPTDDELNNRWDTFTDQMTTRRYRGTIEQLAIMGLDEQTLWGRSRSCMFRRAECTTLTKMFGEVEFMAEVGLTCAGITYIQDRYDGTTFYGSRGDYFCHITRTEQSLLAGVASKPISRRAFNDAMEAVAEELRQQNI
eukprot:GFYU01022896.1.p1 GENE.GFYU01022896.1~~GFYU01022896.1.p1  ORF type:complete len:185 (+),score=41.70 GFYU01022896.1:62-556(+)